MEYAKQRFRAARPVPLAGRNQPETGMDKDSWAFNSTI
jgi:hypothetical protein